MHDRFFAERVVDGMSVYDTDFSISMGNLVKKHVGVATTYYSEVQGWISSILTEYGFLYSTSQESKEDSLIRLFEQLTTPATLDDEE
jgi:hypothetical protein